MIQRVGVVWRTMNELAERVSRSLLKINYNRLCRRYLTFYHREMPTQKSEGLTPRNL